MHAERTQQRGGSGGSGSGTESRARPVTTSAVASRLVGGALGIRVQRTEAQIAEDREKMKAERGVKCVRCAFLLCLSPHHPWLRPYLVSCFCCSAHGHGQLTPSVPLLVNPKQRSARRRAKLRLPSGVRWMQHGTTKCFLELTLKTTSTIASGNHYIFAGSLFACYITRKRRASLPSSSSAPPPPSRPRSPSQWRPPRRCRTAVGRGRGQKGRNC